MVSYPAISHRPPLRYVEDIGIGAPGDFKGALSSRIGPFLVWDDTLPAPPPGFVGDPGTNHTVTGSPYNTNVFRVEGPNVGTSGAANLCNGSVNCIQTNLFSLVGKIATNAGVDADRVVYSRSSGSFGSIDVFASSMPAKSIQVMADASHPAILLNDSGTGLYFGRVDLTGTKLPTIEIVNTSDVPPSTKIVPVVDSVVITEATCSTSGGGQLTIKAQSSDTDLRQC